MKPIPLQFDRVKNFILVPSVVFSGLQADPAVLVLLASRRFPKKITLAVLSSLATIFPGKTSWFPALFQAASGKVEPLKKSAAEAILLPRTERNAKHVCRLADTCISVGLGDEAAMLLDQLNDSASYVRRTKARLATWRGELTEAIEILNTSNAKERYQRSLLLGELATLTTSDPALPVEQSYESEKGRVLHMLINSLPYSKSGYAYRTHSILKAQEELGLEPRALTRLGYPALVGQFFAAETDVIDGISYRRQIPAQLRHGLDQKLQQSAEMLAEETRRFRPSVLHTTTHYVNALVVKAVAEAFKIPWVYEVRGQLADTWASSRGPWAHQSERYTLFTQREAALAAQADAVVTLGQNMKENLIAAGVADEKIYLAPNAVGENYLQTPLSTAEARKRLGLPTSSKLMGTVTSVVGYEGLDDLLKAAALMIPTLPELKILIAGDGEALEELKVLAERLNISEYVFFAGRVAKEDAPFYQAALDIFVVPRKNTQVTRSVTPLKSVEASALGKPVIASNLPALAEVVLDGQTGLLFESENPHSLAQTASKLFADPQLAARVGAAGRKWVLETRTWDVNARTYMQVYEHISV